MRMGNSMHRTMSSAVLPVDSCTAAHRTVRVVPDADVYLHNSAVVRPACALEQGADLVHDADMGQKGSRIATLHGLRLSLPAVVCGEVVNMARFLWEGVWHGIADLSRVYLGCLLGLCCAVR